MSTSPSQNFVPISEIRDGVVIMKDGTMRGVLLVSPLNLGLKSVDEQEAVMNGFQNFLNALEFPIQIMSSSRRLDIRPYLMSLENRLHDIPEELLRVQTREYIEFIRWFNEQYNIMSKFFYVIVPYSTVTSTGSSSGMFSGLLGTSKTTKQQKTESFEENRSQLDQRLGIMTQGLSSVGLTSVQLTTEQLIELYHTMFNPGELSASVAPDNK